MDKSTGGLNDYGSSGSTSEVPFDIQDDQVIFYEDLAQSNNMLQFKSKIDEKIDKILGGEYHTENPLSGVISIGDSVSTGDVNSFIESCKNDMSGLADKINSIETLLKKNVMSTIDAQYIEGQDDAFKHLTDATMSATEEVRSSRFFPDSVLSQSEYVRTIRHRVLGTDGRPPLKKYHRIVSLNSADKINDVLTHLSDFMGCPFKLYLTPEENAFELVIIDNSDAFIHFYRKEYVIASTLRIRERIVVEKFREIYDQLAANLSSPKRKGHILDLSKIDASNYVEYTERVRQIFAERFDSKDGSHGHALV